MSSQSIEQISCGSFNEEGAIHSLNRKGFSLNKCFTELIANCIDAICHSIWFNITKKKISIIDDGNGMTHEELIHMFDMNRSNHKNSKSLGVSGLGAKAATAILSKNNGLYTIVYVYTKTVDGDFLVAEIPWNNIFTTLIYTNKISIRQMTSTEIEQFINDRTSKSIRPIGTTILFGYNKELKDEIDNQFDIEKIKYLDIMLRWGVIFGKFNIIMNYSTYEKKEYAPLKMYNYFGGNNISYYIDYETDIVRCFRNIKTNELTYILVDITEINLSSYFHFAKTGRGLDKTLSSVSLPNTRDYEEIGIIRIVNGMRTNLELFDEENVSNNLNIFEKQCSSMCEYDKEHLQCKSNTDTIKHNLSRAQLIRNGQFIGFLDIPEFSVHSARANAEASLKILHLRTEIIFEPLSSQDNLLDIAMGVQENKNQHNNTMPIEFGRMVSFVKNESFKKHKNYFASLIKEEEIKQTKKKEAEQLKKEEERVKQLVLTRLKQEEEERVKQLELTRLKQVEEERVKQLELTRLKQVVKEVVKEEVIKEVIKEEVIKEEVVKEEVVSHINLSIKEVIKEQIEVKKTHLTNELLKYKLTTILATLDMVDVDQSEYKDAYIELDLVLNKFNM
jgi:hypothetical protein